MQDIEPGVSMSRDSIFRIYSMSKALVDQAIIG